MLSRIKASIVGMQTSGSDVVCADGPTELHVISPRSGTALITVESDGFGEQVLQAELVANEVCIRPIRVEGTTSVTVEQDGERPVGVTVNPVREVVEHGWA